MLKRTQDIQISKNPEKVRPGIDCKEKQKRIIYFSRTADAFRMLMKCVIATNEAMHANFAQDRRARLAIKQNIYRFATSRYARQDVCP